MPTKANTSSAIPEKMSHFCQFCVQNPCECKRLSAHTPTPWYVKETIDPNYAGQFYDSEISIHNGKGKNITHHQPDYPNLNEEETKLERSIDSANAQLIAASPIMYDFIRSEAADGNVKAQSMLDSLSNRQRHAKAKGQA